MSIIFGGGETSSFTRFNALEATTSGTFRAPARCAMHISKSGWIKSAPLLDRSDLWFHMDVSVGLFTSSLIPIVVLDNTGATVFAIKTDGTIMVGTATIGLVSPFTTGLSTIDFHLKGGSSGQVEIYVNQQVIFSSAGNYSALANMRTLMLSAVGQDTTQDTRTAWSQVIVADEVTIGFQLATVGLTAAGSASDWIGTVDKINEVILDDTTYINAATTALTNNYTTTGIDTSYTNIKAVIMTALARYSADGGPTNLYTVAHVGSTDYLQIMNTIGVGFTPTLGIMHTNPATSAAWTPTTINTSQFGLKSRI